MIEKYLDAFPFSNSYIAKDEKFAIYLKDMSGETKLHILDLGKSKNYSDGTLVCDEDFSKRSYRPCFYNPKNGLFYIVSDTENKEDFNIFSLNLETREFKQVTNSSYCGVYGVSDDYSKLVYGDRYKTDQGMFYTRLYLMDLDSGESQLLCDDADWEYRQSWSGVVFDKNMENIYFTLDKDNNRKEINIFKQNLASKEITKVLPVVHENNGIYILNHLIDSDGIYYASTKCGFENLYHFDLNTQEVTKLTDYSDNFTGLNAKEDNKTVHLSIALNEENKTLLVELSLDGKNPPKRKEVKLDGAQYMMNSKDLWMTLSTFDNPGDIRKYNFTEEGNLESGTVINNVLGNLNNLVHNKYRFVKYESFDGEMVPAFLSVPKSGEIKGAIVTSFYGGNNSYSWLTQMFSELGIAVLSPGVRGTWSYGKEWREKILGDLGGDEILDVHWGAKFLEKELGLDSSKIGVRGGSHGGYAVLRAMTMPSNFKDEVDCSYPYGFGICWAGFADLEDFYETSNIPDWLVNMLGPYKGNEQKYRQRSPIHDFDNLEAPLFVAHGLNDARVSATSMEGFIDKLKASDKEYTLHIMEGLGHGAGNRDEEIAQYTKVKEFVESVLQGK